MCIWCHFLSTYDRLQIALLPSWDWVVCRIIIKQFSLIYNILILHFLIKDIVAGSIPALPIVHVEVSLSKALNRQLLPGLHCSPLLLNNQEWVNVEKRLPTGINKSAYFFSSFFPALERHITSVLTLFRLSFFVHEPLPPETVTFRRIQMHKTVTC